MLRLPLDGLLPGIGLWIRDIDIGDGCAFLTRGDSWLLLLLLTLKSPGNARRDEGDGCWNFMGDGDSSSLETVNSNEVFLKDGDFFDGELSGVKDD